MGPTVQPFAVSVLLHKDGNAWVAQCLERDLVAQGPTVEEAKSRFVRTLRAQIVDDILDGNEPLSKLPPAPPRFFDQLGYVRESGPELPMYVKVEEPASTQAATVRFLKQKAA